MSEFTWDWQYAWSVMPLLLTGLVLTIQATILGSILAVLIGLMWTLLRMARLPVLSPAANLMVEFLRGTPFLMQIYFIFYVFPNYGITLSAMMTGVIGLGLYYSAYLAEVYRAGIEGVPVGQWEASLTLGLPVPRVWTGIILPQVVKVITPMVGNYVIVAFKETALLSTITVTELLHHAMDAGLERFRFVEPLTMAGILYLLLSYPSARAVRAVEERYAARA